MGNVTPGDMRAIIQSQEQGSPGGGTACIDLLNRMWDCRTTRRITCKQVKHACIYSISAYISVCVCVCVCVCVYIYIYIYIYGVFVTRDQVNSCLHVSVCMIECMCVCVYIYIYTNTHTWAAFVARSYSA
jgi:hypothetical protein